ncbi:hypothetical protein BDR26DRAFT_858086 [Obelidium mucronatum]|nr:hypothetical protein BDR26DRAFT_858086 [Obelidium mucronatum]
MAPGAATVDYTITAWHNGGCIITLSQDNQKTWTKIGEDKTCGIQSKNPSGRGSINVVMPSGTYNAVLRWTYTADNGGSPNEIFTNCADISVSASGNNKHDKVEFLGPAASGFVALAKSPSKYFDSSCPSAGASLCSSNKAFINKCIKLGAGGGFPGGSSWYSIQLNGVDTCSGSGVPPPPTSKTTKKATATTPPKPNNGKPCPVTADNSLLLPIPKGKTCVDVKHACQTYCFDNKWYEIQRNQCFSEDPVKSTAIQWCQCNNVIYYGVAFGKPTTACPK